MRIIVYRRGRNSSALVRQLRVLTRYAAKNNHTIVGYYAGQAKAEVALADALLAVGKLQADAIVATSLDRLSRSVAVAALVVQSIEQKGAQFVTVKAGRITSAELFRLHAQKSDELTA